LKPAEDPKPREDVYHSHPVKDWAQGPNQQQEEEKNMFETNPEELQYHSRGQMMGQQFLGNIGGGE